MVKKRAKIALENHYGANVWTHKKMDKLRKAECLCLNCLKMDICATARLLFDACRKTNIALAVTRCPAWASKKNIDRRKKVV